MTTAISWAIVALIALAILIVVLARLYVRANRETSLVRTGVGGRKVVMDGGLLAIPYFHEVARINMQTLRLEIARTGEAALITKDRLRVDVGVVFYVTVSANTEGIARAAQTLGNRTYHAEPLRDLIEGKLVDALRSVAARMTMDELHENRGVFVTEVRDGLRESLARNGLELDSVSLTALDQTPFRALDENNAFNAAGMRKLAEVIAKSRKERAEIDADAEVSVRRAAMEAARRRLQIELEEKEAEIAQVQQIETLRAAQVTEVVRRKAESERESARARIEMEQAIRAAEIAKEQALQEAEIARERDLELVNQERQITIARKSQEETKARAAADAARAEAVSAAESIETARQVAEAERRREVALLAARQAAETRVHEAKADAEALEARAAGRRAELLATAEGQRAVVAAENGMDERIVRMKVDLARLEAMPRLVAEMVKPAEKIESIKVHHISGLGAAPDGHAAGAGGRPPVSQVLDSILDMAVQLPALRRIGEEIGASLQDELAGLTGARDPQAPRDKPAEEE